MSVRAELLPLAALSEEDHGRWRDLAAEAAEPNPFFGPAFARPAAAALGEDRVSLLIAREAEDGPWLGCLPVSPTRRWRGVPVPGLASWVNLYCFWGAPLLAPGREREALEAMLPAALAEKGYLGLSLLPATGPVAEALDAAADATGLRVIRYERSARGGLRRREDPEGYISANKKHQRGFRRLRRRLGEEFGGEPETVDRAGEAEAVDRFLALEASGWKGREGTAFASIEGHAEMLREICRAFSAEGRLQLLSFEVAGRALAMACNLRAGGTIFCFKIGFDEGFARFSPGIQLELDNARIFHERTDAAVMDSCAVPGNEMIEKLWADRIPIQAVVVTTRGRAVLLRPLVAGLGAIRARFRA